MLKVVPLGGLGEIGLNMMVLECEGTLLVIDAGLMFPDEYMPGVDLVIPNFQYLRERADRIAAVLLTHGHEDHIGAMPFFLREFAVPVYSTRFTLELLKEKLKEHHILDTAILRPVVQGEISRFGPFWVEYIRVNHSIVEGLALAIQTPVGTLIHSGDFRIDPTPMDGQPTDLNRFAHYGEQGVLALLSDSTNAEKEGHTLSERAVRGRLEELFRSCKGRIILSSFASNISRIQQVVDLAHAFQRKILFNGKSMLTNVGIAKQERLLTIPEGLDIRESQLDAYPDHRLAIVTTGSQGEPMSALTRIAGGIHKKIRVKRGDTVIFSSRFIPGNERAIAAVINSLYRMGAEVVYEKVSEIHSSGHAMREELRTLIGLVRPTYFLPIHGEYRHLINHGHVAEEMGIPPERILIVENGTPVHFETHGAHIAEAVPTGRVLVDGKGVGDVGEVILRDRRRLSSDGMVIVLMAMDEHTGDVVYGPDILSRGFVFEGKAGTGILEDAKCIVLEVLDEMERPPIDLSPIESDIERRLKKFFYRIIERSPLVLPVILPV